MPQPVDPFTPIHRGPLQPPKRPRVRPSGLAVDVRRPPRPKPMAQQPAQQLVPKHNVEHPETREIHTGKARPRRFIQFGQYALFGLGIVITGVLLQFEAGGEILVCLYGMATIIKRVPSRVTFTLALVCLITIAVLMLARPDQTLMKNFATYALLFLLIGAISLLREARD